MIGFKWQLDELLDFYGQHPQFFHDSKVRDLIGFMDSFFFFFVGKGIEKEAKP